MERDNAGQAGITEQIESSDWIGWIFQGMSGKQTDSHSIALILPACPFRALSRLFRYSRLLLNKVVMAFFASVRRNVKS
jgi:hypothetical protein